MIFGRRATLKIEQSLQKQKTMERKRKAEEEEKRKKKEEEKLRRQKEREEQEADDESDHHGRIYVDYRNDRPSPFPVKYKFTSEIKVGHGTFAQVFMCKM